MVVINMQKKFGCPINYNLNECSSREYGLTCETCFHMDDSFETSGIPTDHKDWINEFKNFCIEINRRKGTLNPDYE